jgi:hypothetical protein
MIERIRYCRADSSLNDARFQLFDVHPERACDRLSKAFIPALLDAMCAQVAADSFNPESQGSSTVQFFLELSYGCIATMMRVVKKFVAEDGQLAPNRLTISGGSKLLL